MTMTCSSRPTAPARATSWLRRPRPTHVTHARCLPGKAVLEQCAALLASLDDADRDRVLTNRFG